MDILEIKNVAYSYANSKEKVLSGVNQKFELGKFYAIVGKSEQENLHFFPYLLDLINLKQEKYCLRMKIYKIKDIVIIEKIIYL